MHRLEITGATPEDLFMNAVRMLSVLLKGGATPLPAKPAPPSPSSDNGSSEETQHGGSTPSDGASDRAVEAFAELVSTARKAKRGAKAKIEKTEELNDPIPDLAAGGKVIEHEPQNLTLDGDIRPRLRAIQKAHSERGNDMPACVEYIMKLYGPFGVKKADQLKPEQFAEFLEASEAYLSGEA